MDNINCNNISDKLYNILFFVFEIVKKIYKKIYKNLVTNKSIIIFLIKLVIIIILLIILIIFYLYNNNNIGFNMSTIIKDITNKNFMNGGANKDSNGNKIVVFDLDETIGHFSQLGVFYECLERHFGREIPKDYLKELLKLYPEYFRPNIMNIFKYLKQAKRNGKCHNVMIFTNNQGPNSWTDGIKDYIHDKIKYNLFDQVIRAFKISGQQVEIGRTSHDKTVKDLLRCTKLPENTEIFFLDDQFHPKMENDNVMYFHLKPYAYEFNHREMIERYMDSKIGKTKLKDNNTNDIDFMENMIKLLDKYSYGNEFGKKRDYKTLEPTFKETTNEIIIALKSFLSNGNNNVTKRKRKRKGKGRREKKNGRTVKR